MTELRVHEFTPDSTLAADWRGLRPCTCGLPKPNRVHEVPETPPEVAELRDRMLGETNE